MNAKIIRKVDELTKKIVNMRRDFHRYPEPGWTEFRTASIVLKTLKKLGYEIKYGSDVIEQVVMMGVPSVEIIAAAQTRAISQGADPELVGKMSGGKTGVVALLDTGRQGSTVGFRFDMDALPILESQDDKHVPYKKGFASLNIGSMHACGHDAHTAIGLGVAEVLMSLKDELRGRIKLVFQPAEEGSRGAKSMMEAGVVDDVDFLIGVHVGLSRRKTGQIICGAGEEGFTATTKVDVTFKGVPSHAGASPQLGNNTLLAAASAALNLHAISRSSDGFTRINVGQLISGSMRNIIPSLATMKIETRGANKGLDQYMLKRAKNILNGTATMYDVEVSTEIVGSLDGGSSSIELANHLSEIAKEVPGFTEIEGMGPFSAGGAEDCVYFMSRVQDLGGQATYIILGTELAAGHHNQCFDINEEVLPLGVKFLSEVAYKITNT